MKRVYAYLRDSGGPGQERSIPEQRAALQTWADEQGYLITRWYADAARSGTIEERAEFQRLITEALREARRRRRLGHGPLRPGSRRQPLLPGPLAPWRRRLHLPE